jgi:diguanylate cyclase (GGDEF)-like protein
MPTGNPENRRPPADPAAGREPREKGDRTTGMLDKAHRPKARSTRAEKGTPLNGGGQAVLDFIDRVERLITFQDRLETPASIEQVWALCRAEVRDSIRVEVCALYLVDRDSQEFRLHSAHPESAADTCSRELDLQIESGMFSSVFTRRQLALLRPMAFDSAFTLVLLPLTTVKRTLGAVLAVTPVAEDAITRESLKLMELLNRQCALMLENTLLYQDLVLEREALIQANEEIRQLSRTDLLTGVFNRNHLSEAFPYEIKRAQRYGGHLAVILTDIDHFKKVNDNHGHPAGDQVLRSFAAVLTGMIRADLDWVARYGGEEFLVVLPETGLEGATALAERLRTTIENGTVAFDGNLVRITASFGVTAFNALDGEASPSPHELFSRVDQLLYEAKGRGRNRVVSGPFPG